jgi:hypothetical protein
MHDTKTPFSKNRVPNKPDLQQQSTFCLPDLFPTTSRSANRKTAKALNALAARQSLEDSKDEIRCFPSLPHDRFGFNIEKLWVEL